jgi:hypothetical protein
VIAVVLSDVVTILLRRAARRFLARLCIASIIEMQRQD